MEFRVVDRSNAPSQGGEVLLVKDNWNDWFIWITQFSVIVVREDGTRVDVGAVKIGRVGMTRENPITWMHLPEQFPSLDPSWFSIGQSENYYETLESLSAETRDWFLRSLRDCAYNLSILEENLQETVLNSSLLRDIDQDRVRNRLHRLAHGNAVLTSFAFQFTFPDDPLALAPAPELTFRVRPNSRPPSNVHVLIGRNGVGKTRCFNFVSRAFLNLSAHDGEPIGDLKGLDVNPFTEEDQEPGFAGLITVSFSPFDKTGPLAPPANSRKRYAYVGLAHQPDNQNATEDQDDILTVKSHAELTDDFVGSVAECLRGARRTRWIRALQLLEADPLFEEVNVASIGEEAGSDWRTRARGIFRRLSSGHSVVLLTITRLIELVEERSLVLIDEPESHLHPPLLSAFIRALSDLLIDRNGVGIIATHSPVVLQEVPRDCVWILNRSGHASRAERPDLETFGENTGILTREVFGLEVTQTGFHRMISEAVRGSSYEDVLQAFGDQLGGEAQGLARALSLIPPEVAEEEGEA
ncbi:MAG: AAA family ATPase [Pseudomonadota bacterium]